MSWFSRKKKPEPERSNWRLHQFDPKPGITAYELALILANTFVGTSGTTIAEGVWIKEGEAPLGFLKTGSFPDVARHFTPTDLVKKFDL